MNNTFRSRTAILFEFRISKKEQVSNRGRKELTDSQQTSAATDIWLDHKIYKRFEQEGLT